MDLTRHKGLSWKLATDVRGASVRWPGISFKKTSKPLRILHQFLISGNIKF